MSEINKRMRAEARSLIERAIDTGKVRAVEWYVEQLVKMHPKWYCACAYGWSRWIIGDVMRAFEPEQNEEVEEQLRMPGFERLQRAYRIKREKVWMIVSLQKMTALECREKAAEHETAAQGHLTHSRELIRWAEQIEASE